MRGLSFLVLLVGIAGCPSSKPRTTTVPEPEPAAAGWSCAIARDTQTICEATEAECEAERTRMNAIQDEYAACAPAEGVACFSATHGDGAQGEHCSLTYAECRMQRDFAALNSDWTGIAACTGRGTIADEPEWYCPSDGGYCTRGQRDCQEIAQADCVAATDVICFRAENVEAGGFDEVCFPDAAVCEQESAAAVQEGWIRNPTVCAPKS